MSIYSVDLFLSCLFAYFLILRAAALICYYDLLLLLFVALLSGCLIAYSLFCLGIFLFCCLVYFSYSAAPLRTCYISSMLLYINSSLIPLYLYLLAPFLVCYFLHLH
jgi:hypothetical protein